VNVEERLAEVVTALEAVGLSCLVLGGHAARYYGLSRTTNDYDFHLAPEGWPDLPQRLARTSLFAGQPVIEGPSWRPGDFRRFQIGRLPDGREEWLEFWRHNHLLAPFAQLQARREQGTYGGRTLSFLSLPDLIRSKETERASDWLDVAFLEEALDARLLAGAASGTIDSVTALAQLRSRSGFQGHLERGYLNDTATVQRALRQAPLPMTVAYLLPSAPATLDLPATVVRIEPVVVARLRTVSPGSTLHLALVEAVRRQYKLACQEADRADKQAVRAAQGGASSPASQG
jgi:hypothetical protein